MSQEIDTSEESAMDQVFRFDELREEILMCVILDNNGKISRKMLKTVRLVQKGWLQTSTEILLTVREPLIALTLDGSDSIQRTKDDEVKGKQWDQLVERFGTLPRLQESFIPVKVNFRLDFFRERNYQSLSDCLTRLGSDLVELQMVYPKSGGTMLQHYIFMLLGK